MEGKQYCTIYVSNEVAKQINQLKESDALDKFIIWYIEETKRDWKWYCDSLNDDLLMYKWFMAKAKQERKQAFIESTDAHYKLWEESDKERKSLQSNVKMLTEELKPLKRELEEIDKLLKAQNLYQLKELIEWVKLINSMYWENKACIQFLMDNYKRNIE